MKLHGARVLRSVFSLDFLTKKQKIVLYLIINILLIGKKILNIFNIDFNINKKIVLMCK